jgi:hypothetical protein
MKKLRGEEWTRRLSSVVRVMQALLFRTRGCCFLEEELEVEMKMGMGCPPYCIPH